MRYPVGGLALGLAAVVGAVVAGCTVTTGGTPAPAERTHVAPAGGELAGCALPITFSVPKGWTAEMVDVELDGAGDDPLAELFRKGPFEVTCEADGRPSGVLGFLRVYTTTEPGDGPRGALEAFVAGDRPDAQAAGSHEVRNPVYTDLRLGGRPAAEVSYETGSRGSESDDSTVAFAVDAPGGPVVVELDGLEADSLRPVYELAKRTVRVT